MQRPEKRSETGKTLFSLDSLIASQEVFLKKMDVTVIRDAGVNDSHDNVSFRPDTSFWDKELGIFSAADIGKPSLYSRYRIEKSDSSGLLFTNYLTVDPEIDGTSFLSVARDSAGHTVRIEINQQEKNYIFRRKRNMILNFRNDPASGYNILSGYKVTGYQKMLLKKSVNYNLNVLLKWDDPV
jgi:hypothetical protein